MRYAQLYVLMHGMTLEPYEFALAMGVSGVAWAVLYAFSRFVFDDPV